MTTDSQTPDAPAPPRPRSWNTSACWPLRRLSFPRPSARRGHQHANRLDGCVMLKWAIASIPALIILSFAGAFPFALLGAAFR